MTNAADTDEGVQNDTSKDENADVESAKTEASKGGATKSESAKSENAKGDAAETGTTVAGSAQSSAGSATSRSTGERRKVAESGAPWWQSVRALAVLAVLALVAAVTFGALWATDDSADQLSALQSSLDTEVAAETAASEYALRVSAVDFRDLDAWREALTNGVSEQLAPKLEAAVDVVGPWLSQMEYTATARLLAADVSETDGDRFVVQVFVDMTSKSKQTPDGVAATATYTVTMDRASNWTITDVGGVGGALPGAGSPGAGGR